MRPGHIREFINREPGVSPLDSVKRGVLENAVTSYRGSVSGRSLGLKNEAVLYLTSPSVTFLGRRRAPS